MRPGGDVILEVLQMWGGGGIAEKLAKREKKAYQVQIIANHPWLFLLLKKGFKEENCSPAVTSAATVMPGDT